MSDNTIEVESCGNVFKNLCKKGIDASKKMEKNVLSNSGEASEIGTNLGTAFAYRSLEAALSSFLEAINFYHRGEGL